MNIFNFQNRSLNLFKLGLLDEELPCWRPRGDSVIYELRRFFIGGSPELEDISYASIPSDHEVCNELNKINQNSVFSIFQKDSILSRLGFRTTTTGHIKIRLNTVFQSQ